MDPKKVIKTDPETLIKFSSPYRRWQGIPGIEKTRNGRLIATFYSGGETEQLGNYCMIVYSDDDGKTWTEPVAAAYAGETHRAFDACIWIDPLGRLWFIWAIRPDHSVWYSRCDDPDGTLTEWTEPQELGGEVALNKPTVLSTGAWLFPSTIWNRFAGHYTDKSSTTDRRAFVYQTLDQGQSFTRLGGTDLPYRWFDEHMIVERKDGSLAMYVRTVYGIGISYSYDGGKTWSEGEDTGICAPNSRFFIRRISTGDLLLVTNNSYSRNNLTAMISRDDGKTWEGYLILDERDNVAYPDGIEDKDGKIYIIYDHNRRTDKEILMAVFTPEDVLAGHLINPNSYLRAIVSKV